MACNLHWSQATWILKQYSLLFVSLLLLCSCGAREDLAPVVELKWKATSIRPRQHTVDRGETLYAIAFRYDLDYRQLAKINHLKSPYLLRVGQNVKLTHPKSTQHITPQPAAKHHAAKSRLVKNKPKTKIRTAKKPANHKPAYQNGSWLWPVRGKIRTYYAPKQGKKGIDIAGKRGEKIRAAARGIVAYAGDGLPGYGNLIIIKHDRQYLTAYANNLRNIVKEGQTVKAGQVIAEMGMLDRRFYGLHFEIRKTGVPENPLNYLKLSSVN